jgi:hypothetical protein
MKIQTLSVAVQCENCVIFDASIQEMEHSKLMNAFLNVNSLLAKFAMLGQHMMLG